MHQRRNRPLLSLLLVVVLSLPLGGCWDRRELEDMGFVLTMGLDKGPEGAVMVTFVVAKPGLLGGAGEKGGGEGQGKPYLVLPVIAPSITTAMNVANSFASRRLTLIHCNAIVIGHELAESGLDPYMTEMMRFRELRGTASIFTAQGSARQLLEGLQLTLETDPGKLFLNAMATFEYTGFLPRATLFGSGILFVSTAEDMVTGLVALREPGDGAKETNPPEGSYREGTYTAGSIPRPVTTNTLEYHGLAMYKRGRLVGTLTGAETTIYNMIKGTFGTAFCSIPDPQAPDKWITVELRQGRPPEVSVQWPRPDSPLIHIQLEVEGDIAGIQSLIDYIDPRKIPELEQAISRLLESDARQTIATSQAAEADIFGLGLHVRSRFATYSEWEQFAWGSRYGEVEIKANVKAHIRRIGLQDEPIRPM